MDARVNRSWIITIAFLSLANLAGAQTFPGQPTQVASRQPLSRSASNAQASPGFKLPPGASGPYRPDSLQSGDQQATPPSGLGQRFTGQEMDETKIIARVGDQVVLAGDLYGQVNQFLHARIQEIPEAQRSQVTPDLINQRRWQLIKQMLPGVIDGKLVYLDFLRNLPKERIPEIQDSLYKAFDEQQLPNLIERAKVQTAADLDKLLRSFGSSLDQQRLAFAEQLAAAQWRGRNSSSSGEISHEDLIGYYREHQEEYRIVAKSKWEQLSALDRETGSRDASRKLIAEMGNAVFHGAAFAATAKKSSHGSTASSGGSFDWTTKGSLRSEIIDEAIFTLPVGYLSKILEDDDGCHIIRVVERQEESFVPFAKAQDSIRTLISEERSDQAMKKYVEDLRKEFPVWTLFDEQPDYVGGSVASN